MFERFTERSRQVVTYAMGEAHNLKHNYVGSEHILLGLLLEGEGLGAQVLEHLGADYAHTRERIKAIIGEGEEVREGQPPLTPRGKKILELALREALSLGQNYIGTEHILLGLVRTDDGVAKRVLYDLGVNVDEIRNEVIRKLAGEPDGPEPEQKRSDAILAELAEVGALRERVRAIRTADPEPVLAALDVTANKLRGALGRTYAAEELGGD